jgi:hypothetical protein
MRSHNSSPDCIVLWIRKKAASTIRKDLYGQYSQLLSLAIGGLPEPPVAASNGRTEEREIDSSNRQMV